LGAAGLAPPGASAIEQLDLAERLLLTWPARLFPHAVAPVIAGLVSFALASRLLGDLASAEERDAVRRALPYNPTTEMDLALWDLARQVHSDATATAVLRECSSADLTVAFRSGTLPSLL